MPPPLGYARDRYVNNVATDPRVAASLLTFTARRGHRSHQRGDHRLDTVFQLNPLTVPCNDG